MVVLGWQLDLMILEVFSNLWFYDSMILWSNLPSAFWMSALKTFVVEKTGFAPEFLTCSVWDFTKQAI